MIKNIIFDFGNIIVKFNDYKMVSHYTENEEAKKFLIDNVIYSDEWVKGGKLDLGELNLEEMANSINERTNNIYKEEVYNFCTDFPNKLVLNDNILDIIKELKNKGYKLYILSNTCSMVFDLFFDTLEPLFDGMVLSYKIHVIKPHEEIYNYLLNKYNLKAEECLFLDDREDNIKAGNKIGINGRTINKDDINDIISVLKDYNVL